MSEVTTTLDEKENVSLLVLFITFLKIGSTAFGGFMALISVVQNYVVERKKLISHSVMMDGISLATILPGPVAVNVVAYAGYQIRGLAGALVCTIAVIIPSFLLIVGLSYAYFTWGEIPSVSHIFNGFQPAVAAIILMAAVNMSRKTLSTYPQYALTILSMLALILVGGFYITLAIIVVSGVAGYLMYRSDNKEKVIEKKKIDKKQLAIPAMGISALVALIVFPLLKTSASVGIKLFTTFSGMSLLLFGGGYVFIPLIQEVVVDTHGWVSHREFIDGIALGQITPGPILISATFIGYKVAGIAGALAATIGIFTPPAILMLVCTSLLDTIRSSAVIKAVLQGIRCGVIGMIAAAAFVVINSSEPTIISALIFTAAMVALMKFKLEVVWIIPVAGLIGFVLY
ncbi:MAG: chromate efflux transporter [Gammaproteobacteria bacterium]|jgi:chromate transporter|nr:chromate efflux transporter [Gammaproteobacteria bacterium]